MSSNGALHMLKIKWFGKLVIQAFNSEQGQHSLEWQTKNQKIGSIYGAQMGKPGNQLLKSSGLQYWDEKSLMAISLKSPFVKHGRWPAGSWASPQEPGVVCKGAVVLLVDSETWDGSVMQRMSRWGSGPSALPLEALNALQLVSKSLLVPNYKPRSYTKSNRS